MLWHIHELAARPADRGPGTVPAVPGGVLSCSVAALLRAAQVLPAARALGRSSCVDFGRRRGSTRGLRVELGGALVDGGARPALAVEWVNTVVVRADVTGPAYGATMPSRDDIVSAALALFDTKKAKGRV